MPRHIELDVAQHVLGPNPQHQQPAWPEYAAQLGQRALDIGPEVADVDTVQLVEGTVLMGKVATSEPSGPCGRASCGTTTSRIRLMRWVYRVALPPPAIRSKIVC